MTFVRMRVSVMTLVSGGECSDICESEGECSDICEST